MFYCDDRAPRIVSERVRDITRTERAPKIPQCRINILVVLTSRLFGATLACKVARGFWGCGATVAVYVRKSRDAAYDRHFLTPGMGRGGVQSHVEPPICSLFYSFIGVAISLTPPKERILLAF